MNTQNTREQIGEIIGEASMCWSKTPTGVFQSDKAVMLIDKLEAIASQSRQQGRMEIVNKWMSLNLTNDNKENWDSELTKFGLYMQQVEQENNLKVK